MLFELLQKGYGKEMNLNCAEKILYGANWAYNMQLRRRRLKLRQALAEAWVQVLPAAWLPVRAWCLALCM